MDRPALPVEFNFARLQSSASVGRQPSSSMSHLGTSKQATSSYADEQHVGRHASEAEFDWTRSVPTQNARFDPGMVTEKRNPELIELLRERWAALAPTLDLSERDYPYEQWRQSVESKQVTELKQQVTMLKADISALKTDMETVRGENRQLKMELDSMKQAMLETIRKIVRKELMDQLDLILRVHQVAGQTNEDNPTNNSNPMEDDEDDLETLSPSPLEQQLQEVEERDPRRRKLCLF